MKTYRYSGHSRSDPASYRPDGELEAWMERDPIKLFNNTLVSKKVLGAEDLDNIIKETNSTLNKIKEKVSKSSEPTEDYLFKNIYSE